MDLKTLLGENYKDDMSIDDINKVISGMKLADLSTGMYVNKDAAEAEKRKLENEKNELNAKLSEKLTDDEKAAKIAEDKDRQIKQLMDQLKANTINANKSQIYSSTAEYRGKLGIGDDDKDFQDFVGLITLEDGAKNTTIATYLSNIIKNAYTKGVEDTKKDQIAGNSKVKTGGTSNTGNDKGADENIGSKIAKANQASVDTDTYFKI